MPPIMRGPEVADVAGDCSGVGTHRAKRQAAGPLFFSAMRARKTGLLIGAQTPTVLVGFRSCQARSAFRPGAWLEHRVCAATGSRQAALTRSPIPEGWRLRHPAG